MGAIAAPRARPPSREAEILTGIDDHSRFVICAGLMVRATSRAVCLHFAEAVRRHGVPQEILTDNGKVFTGRFGTKDTEVLFDRICREKWHRPPAHRAAIADHDREGL